MIESLEEAETQRESYIPPPKPKPPNLREAPRCGNCKHRSGHYNCNLFHFIVGLNELCDKWEQF